VKDSIVRSFGLLLVAGLAWFGCDTPVERVSPTILLTLPHDTAAYTQGLVYSDRLLWESTGRRGRSEVRKVDPETGQVLLSRPLPDSLFGEGLTLVGTELIQLTWTAGTAFVYDADSLYPQRTFTYDGEGWGLCFDGSSLFMTNGSDSLYRRDPETFRILDARAVTLAGNPLPRLNELECVGDHIWANIYRENRLVEIDKATGRVVREVSGLVLSSASGVPDDGDAVLNGIAYAESGDAFFLTGKLWPQMYVVRIPDRR